MKTLQGKRALLTGAASGIGRAIAIALAKQGTHLYLLDIDDAKLADTADQARSHGVEVITQTCDVAKPEAISATVQCLLNHWGRLDILINNAGVAYHGPTHRMSADQWNWLLGINLHAPIQFTRELLPTLLSQPESHILNVCSILGLVAVKELAAYQASKYALVGFSESLRAEYTAYGLGVTALCPGFVRTNIFNAAVSGKRNKSSVRKPPAWVCTSPEKVAVKAVKAIRRNQGLKLVTPLAHVFYAIKRLSPTLFAYLSRRKKKAQRPIELRIMPKADVDLRKAS